MTHYCIDNHPHAPVLLPVITEEERGGERVGLFCPECCALHVPTSQLCKACGFMLAQYKLPRLSARALGGSEHGSRDSLLLGRKVIAQVTWCKICRYRGGCPFWGLVTTPLAGIRSCGVTWSLSHESTSSRHD